MTILSPFVSRPKCSTIFLFCSAPSRQCCVSWREAPPYVPRSRDHLLRLSELPLPLSRRQVRFQTLLVPSIEQKESFDAVTREEGIVESRQLVRVASCQKPYTNRRPNLGAREVIYPHFVLSFAR